VVTLHKKIQDIKDKELPINYRSVSVNEMGAIIQTRKKYLDEGKIEGYGCMFGVKNQHNEKFVKGAFAKAIRDLGPDSNSNYKIKFTDRHGRSCCLFEELAEHDEGLYFRTKKMDDVQWAKDMLTQVRSGTINNFSIGFRHVWDKVEWDDEDDCMINLEARLFEIGGVDIPSDMETYAVRSLEEDEYLQDDIEDFIENLTKSKQLEARKLITRCMALIDREQPDIKRRALEAIKQPKTGLDYNYLINNLKIV
jgi:HK97 family phage prohead protease